MLSLSSTVQASGSAFVKTSYLRKMDIAFIGTDFWLQEESIIANGFSERYPASAALKGWLLLIVVMMRDATKGLTWSRST